MRKREGGLCKTFWTGFRVEIVERKSCGKEKNVKRFGETGGVLKTWGKNSLFRVKIFLFNED